MPDILDTIDGAIYDTAVSCDAMRWAPPLPVPPGCEPAPLLRTYRTPQPPAAPLTAEEQAVLRALLGDHIERLTDGIVAALAPTLRHLAGITPPAPPAPPDDPRQRALDARRNRNTGPTRTTRAPRNIDPTRAR